MDTLPAPIILSETRLRFVLDHFFTVLQNFCGEIPRFSHVPHAPSLVPYFRPASRKHEVLQNICGEVLQNICGGVAEYLR